MQVQIIPKLGGQSKTQLLSVVLWSRDLGVAPLCPLAQGPGAGGRAGATLISRLSGGGSASSLPQEVAGRMQFLTGSWQEAALRAIYNMAAGLHKRKQASRRERTIQKPGSFVT